MTLSLIESVTLQVTQRNSLLHRNPRRLAARVAGVARVVTGRTFRVGPGAGACAGDGIKNIFEYRWEMFRGCLPVPQRLPKGVFGSYTRYTCYTPTVLGTSTVTLPMPVATPPATPSKCHDAHPIRHGVYPSKSRLSRDLWTTLLTVVALVVAACKFLQSPFNCGRFRAVFFWLGIRLGDPT
jgi:hypothetical protein